MWGFLSFIWNVALILGVLAIGLLSLLYYYQNSLIYMPSLAQVPRSPSGNIVGLRSPKDRQLTFKDVTLGTIDGQTLKGWLILQENSKEYKTVVFFHENAGNIGTRLQYLEYYYKRVNVNILIVAYRGYSDSTGEPNEQGLMLDGEAIVNFAMNRPELDNSQIYLHGRSLGGAVLIHVMTQNVANRIKGVIIENTFTSIDDMAELMFPYLKRLKNIILRNHWPSITRIDKIKVPILFVLSMQDEIVPPQMMVKLQNKAKVKYEQLVFEDGDHNSNWTRDIDLYFNTIKKFLNQY